MTYRAKCAGRKGKKGRRTFNLKSLYGTSPNPRRGFWVGVTGSYKKIDRDANALGEEFRRKFEAGEIDFGEDDDEES